MGSILLPLIKNIFVVYPDLKLEMFWWYYACNIVSSFLCLYFSDVLVFFRRLLISFDVYMLSSKSPLLM